MPTTVISSDVFSTTNAVGTSGTGASVIVPTNNDVFVLPDVVVQADGNGMQLYDNEHQVTVLGSVVGGNYGAFLRADGTKDFNFSVSVGQTGSISGNSFSAISMFSIGGQPELLGFGEGLVQNAGYVSAIHSSAVSLSSMANATVINSGTITSLQTAGSNGSGVRFQSVYLATLQNTGTISNSHLGDNGGGTNAKSAVFSDLYVEKFIFNNSGTISSPYRAIESRSKNEDISNSGTVFGDVILSTYTTGIYEFFNSGTIIGDVDARGGDDEVTNTGTIQGILELGHGDDTYRAAGSGLVTRQIEGGYGNDTITAAGSDDLIDGGQDNDVINAGGGADNVLGGLGSDIINGGAGDDTLNGEEEADVIRGGSGSDSIIGGTGEDTLAGGVGDDTIIGDSGNDVLRGGSGADLLQGGADNDNIAGGDGNDVIQGGDGEDKLYGGNGDDEIYGGAGKDVMRGNAGADTFYFLSAAESPTSAGDRIRDFQQGQDLIDISSITSFAFIGNAGFSGTGSEVRYQTTNSGLRVDIDVDGDGTADMRINMNGISDLLASDFIL